MNDRKDAGGRARMEQLPRREEHEAKSRGKNFVFHRILRPSIHMV